MIRHVAKSLRSRLDDRPSPSISHEPLQDLALFFKLLSDQTRLKILELLRENGELHVAGLCERLGQSQPTVSHHLALLSAGALIERRREGKHNFYRFKPQRLRELLAAVDATTSEPA